MATENSPRTVLCDLDGVVWLARNPIPGSVEAIARLRESGHRVLFVTNNSLSRVEDQEAALLAIGVPAENDVLTSSMAAALLVQPHERVLVAGGPGVVQALERRGAVCVAAAEVDAGALVDVVVVGLHRDFDYVGLARAARAIHRGARLIGTNDDATYPTPDGETPGGGAILAAVSTAAGVIPVIAGKPYEPMAELVRHTIGADAASRALMVGDRPSTDGLFARTLGCTFALVHTGVTSRQALVQPIPDLRVEDLAAVAEALLHHCP